MTAIDLLSVDAEGRFDAVASMEGLGCARRSRSKATVQRLRKIDARMPERLPPARSRSR